MRCSFAALLATLSVLSPSLKAADIMLASGVTVAPGESRALPLTLASPAAAGVFVTLASSDTSKVTVDPATLYIAAGATTPQVQPQVTGVDFGAANISVSAEGLSGEAQTVRVAATLYGPASATVNRGNTKEITFVLSAPTPTALTLPLRSDNPDVADVPVSVTIPANETTATVPVTGAGAGSTVIHVMGASDIAERTVSITAVAAGAIGLSNVSVGRARSVPFPVILGTPAPAGGVVVTLVSSNTTRVTVNPGTLLIAGGSTAPATQPQVTGVNVGVATITASAPGYASASQVVPVPATLTFRPEALAIAQPGTKQKLSAVLSEPAPWGSEEGVWGPGSGLTLRLTSSNPNVATVPPTLNFYPDGSSFATSVLLVTAVGPGTTVIRASAPPFIPEAAVTVTVGGSGGSGPASITATGGTPQSALVNTQFGTPLSATVRNAGGNPVSGVTVTFTPPAGGPTGSFAGGNTAVTNAAGVATSTAFTANSTPGTYVVQATVAGVASAASFVLTNTATASGGINLPGSVTVGPKQTVTFPVSLTTPAPPGGVTVVLSSSDNSRATITPASVFITGGATASSVQPQVTGVNFGSANISASAPGYASASRTIQVSATLGFSPSNVTIAVAGTQNLALTLSAPAPGPGLTVSLTSSNPGVATVPSTVTFAANATSANVPVTGAAAGSSTITANAGTPNVTNTNAIVTVKGATDIMLASGVAVAPGESRALPITLASPATGGVFVTLASSDTSKVTVNPATLYIAPGATAPLTQPRVTGVTFGTANVSVSAAGLSGDSQTVRVAATLFGPANETVNRGTTKNIIFVLSAPAPTTLTLALRSDNPGVASVPASATIPANQTTAAVPVTGVGAGSTVIHVTAPNVAEKTVGITVVAPAAITLSNVAADLGRTVPFPVILGTPAPAAGVAVTLVSNNTSRVTVNPRTVFIPGGSTAPATQPQVTGVNIGVATIMATAPGYAPASQAVPVPATVTFNPPSLTFAKGTKQKLVLVLSGPAPWGPENDPWGPGAGVTVQLTSSNPNVAAVPPAVSFYPDGSSFASAVLLVTGVGPGTAVIRASAPPFIPETTATVTVLP